MDARTVLSQLQAVGEDALGKLAENPATRGAVNSAAQLKGRGERLVHGLESIDERLSAIEQRLAALEGDAKSARKRADSDDL